MVEVGEYSIDPKGVILTEEFNNYFAKLADLGIELTAGQKAWYFKKAERQLADMKREYPSTRPRPLKLVSRALITPTRW